MIETYFDNCVGPLHSVCRTKFSSWDREKALPIDQSQSKEISSVCQYKGHCIPYLSEFRTWPEFRPVLGCFTFCGVTSRCVTILMMLKCLKMLKINVNSNIDSYFNILRFSYFLKII